MQTDKNPKGLIGELARRGVFQAGALYVAVAWGGTEILITVGDRFGWPGWIASQVWEVSWRQRLGNDRLLDLMGWRESFGACWAAYGPPDGCTWDGQSLNCASAP